jgi:hypothetical protein
VVVVIHVLGCTSRSVLSANRSSCCTIAAVGGRASLAVYAAGSCMQLAVHSMLTAVQELLLLSSGL